LYNPQLELLDYLKSKNIIPQAYSPLGSTNSPLLTDESATEIAKKRGLKSTSDVLLGYLRALALSFTMWKRMIVDVSDCSGQGHHCPS
jgi:diketogulonate reductase-like aldo/keto reductase